MKRIFEVKQYKINLAIISAVLLMSSFSLGTRLEAKDCLKTPLYCSYLACTTHYGEYANYWAVRISSGVCYGGPMPTTGSYYKFIIDSSSSSN